MKHLHWSHQPFAGYKRTIAMQVEYKTARLRWRALRYATIPSYTLIRGLEKRHLMHGSVLRYVCMYVRKLPDSFEGQYASSTKNYRQLNPGGLVLIRLGPDLACIRCSRQDATCIVLSVKQSNAVSPYMRSTTTTPSFYLQCRAPIETLLFLAMQSAASTPWDNATSVLDTSEPSCLGEECP